MGNPIQFGIRVVVDAPQAVPEIERIGAAGEKMGGQLQQAGHDMAAAFGEGTQAISKSAVAVDALAETEAAATERIRAMVAASLQQSSAMAESSRAAEDAVASTRRVSDETANYARVVAAANAQMSQPHAASASGSVATEESQKYVASLQRQFDMLGKSAAEQAQYEAKVLGGTKAVQAQAYALVQNAEALREQIAAEERSGQAAEQFIAKLKEQTATLGLSRTELLSYKAAQLGVSEAAAPMIAKLAETGAGAKGAGGHVDGFSLSTVAARRELIVLGHELSQGNFQKFGGSMMVLAEQSNAASFLFSAAGVGALALAAAVAGVGYAMIKGASDQKHMNDALIMTGNYAGVTADGLNDLAHAAVATGGSIGEAKKVATELAGSGKFTADQIGYITEATVAWEHATGQSSKSIIKDFESIAIQTSGSSARATEAISRATLKLDDQYHFLTESIYEQIRALEKEGDAKGASALATQTFAKATEGRAHEIVSNLGFVARAWNSVKEAVGGASDAVGDWGKKSTAASEVARLQGLLATRTGRAGTLVVQDDPNAGRGRNGIQLGMDRTNMLAALAKAQAELNRVNAEAKAKGDEALRQSEAMHAASRVTAADQQLQKKGMSELQVKLDEYAEDVKKIRAVNPDSALVSDEAIKAHIAAITKAHTASVKGNDDRAKVLQDGLLIEQTALASEKNLYDERDKILSLRHTKLGLSDDEFYAEREKARADYIAAEAISFAKETSMVESFKTKNPLEIAAAKEKYDALVKVHKDFLDKMRGQRAEDNVNQIADAKKTYDAVFNATYTNGVQEVQRLDEAIAKQREHNAEIGKSKEQIELAKQAVVDQETVQLRSDAEYIRSAIEREGYEGKALEAYQLRLNFLDQEVAKRETLSKLLASGAVAEANAKAAHDASVAWTATAKTVETTLADAIANGGGNAWKKLKASIVSQAFSVPINFIGNLAASVLNPTAAQAGSSAVGEAASLINAAKTASSVYSAGMAGMLNSAGTAIATLGNMFGSSAISAFGAGFSGSMGVELTTVSEGFKAAGMASEAAAAGLGEAFAAAVPWVGAAVAAYAVWNKFFEDGPESDTRLTFGSNNAAGNISINERGNEGKSANYIAGSTQSAFGTYGVTSTFWSPAESDVVQSFLKTVSKTDDALANFMTAAEKAAVSTYLTGKTDTVHTGAEGTNQNANGALDAAFADRIKNILEGVSPGLSSLVAGFDGTSQALATEAAALLQYRMALKDSGAAVFGAEVTLQQIAALKTPTELTSAALTRVTSEFAATNQVAQLLGKDSVSAFGAAGLASEAARAQLIQFAGGADALQSKVASFAQTYFTDAERLVPVTHAVDAAMANLGLSNVTTQAQFKATALSLDLATESGQKQFAAMMDLNQSFATAHPLTEAAAEAVKSSADIETQRADLLKQIAEVSMNDAEKAHAAIDQSNQSLYDELQIKLAAKAATDAHTQAIKEANAAIQSDIDALTKAALPLADQRALDVKGMDATTLALYEQREALQAQAKATEDAAKASADAAAAATAAATALATTNAGYQQQIDAILKLSMSAADVRKLEIKGMDASTVALYDRLAALQASTAADKAAATEADAAIKKAQDSAAAAHSALTTAYNAESAALKNTISQSQAFVQAIRAFGNSLLLGDASPLSPQQQYDEAKRQFENASPENLQAASTAFLDASKAFNASGVQYAADFALVQVAIEHAGDAANNQTAVAQQQLSALDVSVAGLVDIKDAVLSVRDALLQDRAATSAVSAAAASMPGQSTAPAAQSMNTQAWNGEGILMPNGSIWDVTTGVHDVGTFTSAQLANASRLDGSHATGLVSVPFDNYHAVLHSEEAVIDAPAMAALRRYFNASPPALTRRATSDSQPNIAVMERHNELLETLITTLKDNPPASAEDIRGLKQHLAHVVSKVAG